MPLILSQTKSLNLVEAKYSNLKVLLKKGSFKKINYRCWEQPLNDLYWGGGVLPYSLGGGVPLGSRKFYPLLDQILQILWSYTRLKMLNCSWFQSYESNSVKRDPILDQFSMLTRPYTRPNGLKTIPFPAAHTLIDNIWEYPPGVFIQQTQNQKTWICCIPKTNTIHKSNSAAPLKYIGREDAVIWLCMRIYLH